MEKMCLVDGKLNIKKVVKKRYKNPNKTSMCVTLPKDTNEKLLYIKDKLNKPEVATIAEILTTIKELLLEQDIII